MERLTEFIIVIVYLAVIMLIAYFSLRRVGQAAVQTDEYYVAGRKVGIFLNSLAILAALGSGGSFMAGAGTTYLLGIPFTGWMTVGSICGFAISSMLVVRPLRNSRTYTITEFLFNRYESQFIKIAVPIVLLVGSALYLMSQMQAAGMIASFLLNWTYAMGMVVTAVIFVIYVAMGGMLAVTWTNALQGGMMVVLVALVTGGVVVHLDVSPLAFLSSVAEQAPQIGNVGVGITIVAGIGAFVSWAAATSVMPHLVMRSLTATNVHAARISLNVGMLIFGLVMFFMILIAVPFISQLGGGIVQEYHPDMFLLFVAEEVLSPVLLGLFAAGLLAAVMSTTSGLLLAASASFAYDLYFKVINPRAEQNKLMLISRVATLVIGAICIYFSLTPYDFLVVLYTAAVGFMVSALFCPLVLGIWWKKANIPGAITGILTGSIIFMILFGGFEMPYNTEVLVALPVSFFSMVVVSLLSEAPSEATLNSMEKLHTD